MIVTPNFLGRDKLSNSNINNPTFIDSLPLISWCRISILRPKFLLVLSVSWESSGCPIYSKKQTCILLMFTHRKSPKLSCLAHICSGSNSFKLSHFSLSLILTTRNPGKGGDMFPPELTVISRKTRNLPHSSCSPQTTCAEERVFSSNLT